MANISIFRFPCGMISTNSYILSKRGSGEAVVIDPADGVLLDALKEKGLKCALVLLTHAHFDHIMGVNALVEEYGCPVAIGEGDADMLVDPELNGSAGLTGRPYAAAPADMLIKDGDEFEAAGISFKAIETKGHTKGGMSYLVDDALFAGDVLFCRGVGRTDLYGGDYGELVDSIRRLYELPDKTGVFPGHGPATSIGEEAASNPYVRRAK